MKSALSAPRSPAPKNGSLRPHSSIVVDGPERAPSRAMLYPDALNPKLSPGRSDNQVACSGAYKSLQNLTFIEREGMLHAGYIRWVAAIVRGINAR